MTTLDHKFRNMMAIPSRSRMEASSINDDNGNDQACPYDEHTDALKNANDNIYSSRDSRQHENGNIPSSLRSRYRSHNDLQHLMRAQEPYDHLVDYDSGESKTDNDIKDQDDGYKEDDEQYKNRNKVLIHLYQWKHYGLKLHRWRHEKMGRSDRSQFPLPPLHLVYGIPYIFLSKCFCLPQTCTNRKTKSNSVKKTCRKLLKAFVFLFVISIMIALYVVQSFINDAIKICRPPPSFFMQHGRRDLSRDDGNQVYKPTTRPLIEYYIHGRGNGHFSRSIAIIQKLNDAGIDVRMFIGQSSLWREVQNNILSKEDEEDTLDQKKWLLEGSKHHTLPFQADLARRVAKIVLFGDEEIQNVAKATTKETLEFYHDYFDSLPWENEYALFYNFVPEDPKYSFVTQEQQSRNFDQARGTTSAKTVASLTPKMTVSTTIAHLTERLFQDCEISKESFRYPNLIVSDADVPGLLRAKLSKIPSVSLSHGTTFSIAETGWKDNDRNWQESWNRQKASNSIGTSFSDYAIGTNFFPLAVKSSNGAIARATLRQELQDLPNIRHMREQRSREENILVGDKFGVTERKKLVLCYFRDKNGEHVVNALLESGFDVLVFNSARGEHKEGISKRYMTHPTERKNIQGFGKNRVFPLNQQNENGVSAAIRNSSLTDMTVTNAQTVHDTSNSVTEKNSDSHIYSKYEKEPIDAHKTLLEILSSPNNEPKRINVNDKRLFKSFMCIVDGIVGSAGSQTLTESIYGRIPILALHRRSDDEQKLNIEMLRRKRDEDLRNIAKMKAKSIYVPKVFGTTVESFVETFSNGTNLSDSISGQQESEHKITLTEWNNYVDTVRSSVVSQSYYNDVFNFINAPYDQEQMKKVKKSGGRSEHHLFNPWLDGLPDASEILLELVNNLL